MTTVDNSEKFGIFDFFKLAKEKRANAQKPKDLKTWIIHGFSEYFGTITISLLLAGLSIFVTSEKVIEHFFLHPIIVGFYAGYIAVGIVLFIFLRWSCDLNPSVTLTRFLNGTNTGWYTLYKLFIQVLGAITAGLIIYGVGLLTTKHAQGLPNSPIDAYNAFEKSWSLIENAEKLPYETKVSIGSVWIFFIEMVMTAILLFPIFSPNINDKYRDLMIMFIISLSVWMGILGGTAAINPARGFAQQLPILIHQSGKEGAYISKSITNVLGEGKTETVTKTLVSWTQFSTSIKSATIAMIFGDLMAPVFYLFVQGITQKYVNPFVVKVIAYKNFKAQNMVRNSEVNKKDK
ncbi:aquaporin [Mycoplasmopsis gallinacea]|uniref:Uncharacterized protein n=1 Tax=Mycoplasmopsis gallinacea TaxID=29556 RepID=A0A449A2H1_9BACT|nr:aquaporin [Mycoplasmopsis gallinacea]VEU58480.1 Uncharacterised protein [Mycoplasmopsis gallinacea]